MGQRGRASHRHQRLDPFLAQAESASKCGCDSTYDLDETHQHSDQQAEDDGELIFAVPEAFRPPAERCAYWRNCHLFQLKR
jgi:hypothetical protein